MYGSKAIALALWAAVASAAFGPRPAGSEANARLQAAQEDAFTADTPLGPKQMKNIMLNLPGSSGKAVVITGHYDTKLLPPISFVGANDGGSSTGLLIELTRVLSGPIATVCMAAGTWPRNGAMERWARWRR